jgi:hypothetical protein
MIEKELEATNEAMLKIKLQLLELTNQSIDYI